MKLFELYADLSLDTSGFDRNVKKASQQGSNLAGILRNDLGSSAAFVVNKMSASTVAIGHLMADTIKAGANVGKQVAAAGVAYNAQMEMYNTNFKTMLGGSAEEAERLTNDLEAMAASTPFAMGDLAGATQTLLQFGQSGDTVLSTLQTLGDISMGDAQKLQSLTLAFGQASSSGKLMGQDLLQMINAGFNPLQTIAEETGASMGELKDFMADGKATGQLRKQMRDAQREVRNMGDEASDGAKMLAQMAEEGAISADLLGQVFAIETAPGGKFYGAMEAASKTYNGLVSTLEDDSTALMGKVMKPLSDFMTDDVLPSAISLIGAMDKAYDIGGLTAAVDAGTDFIGKKLEEWGPMALDAGAALIAGFASGVTGDEVSKEEVKTTLESLWDAGTAGVNGFIDAGETFMRDLNDAISSDPQSEKAIGDKIAGVFKAGASGMDNLLEASGSFLSDLYAAITKDQEGAAKLEQFFGDLGSSMGRNGANAGEFFAGIANAAEAFAQGVAGAEAGDGTPLGSILTMAENTIKAMDAIKASYEESKEAQKTGPLGDEGWLGKPSNGGSSMAWAGATGSLLLTGHPVGAALSAIAAAITPPEVKYYTPPDLMPKGDEYAGRYFETDAPILGGNVSIEWPTIFTGPDGEIIEPWVPGTSLDTIDPSLSFYAGLGDLESVFGDIAKEAEDISVLGDAVQLLRDAAAEIPGIVASVISGAQVTMDGVVVGELILPTVTEGIMRQVQATFKD